MNKDYSNLKDVKKVPTGIEGLDEMLEGGIPEGRSILLTGNTGTGKTVFCNEFIYRGITDYNQNGIYVTFEERPAEIIRNVKNFGWNYESLLEKNNLYFVDLSPIAGATSEIDQKYTLDPIITRIKYAVKKINARRVVLDSIGTIYNDFDNVGEIRNFIFKLSHKLKELSVTSIITAEKTGGRNVLSRHGVEEFVADGVIALEMLSGEQSFIRKIFVRKLRGAGYRSGIVQFEIDNNGIQVFPRLSTSNLNASTSFKERKKFGIEKLDRAMDGGIPEGHNLLISGNTGTGKSLLGLHFAMEGIEEGENTVLVLLEEPYEQVRKTAAQFGWNLETLREENRITVVTAPLIDIKIDRLLRDIRKESESIKAERIVVDSISSILSATLTSEDVRQFMLQYTSFIKNRGITSLLTYLSPEIFGAGSGESFSGIITNEMRLSSTVDGIIILRYKELENKVEKLMNILKLRGSNHDRRILKYEIGDRGIEFQ